MESIENVSPPMTFHSLVSVEFGIRGGESE